MSLKKIFIVVGLVVIVAVSVTMFVLLSQKKGTISQEPAQNQESAIPAVLPSKTDPSVSQENVKESRKIFENIIQESISDKTKKEGLKLIAFENQKGSPIPLSDFEKALGVEMHSKIQEYLSNGYQIFYCPGSGEKKEFGIFLEYNQEKVYIGFSYDVLDMMKDWENTIFPNLHAVLYPNINFSKEELNQKIEFREGKYRYAGVNLPGGEKSSIQYQAVGDGIIVATSLSCLDNLYQHYEPIDP
ncbi:MAG: hypothetical protein NT170_03405 [Candidatus Moranbacteria bacterium]|nr:hypothetical protein [Candidatus Moranbacteria bacterium]